MPINYKNLTPSVYQSSYKKPMSVAPVMSAAPKPTPSVWKKPSTNLYQSAQNALLPPKVATPQKVGGMSYAKPQMSVAPKVIQGSGMTGQYASNPTNYKPKPPVETPPPPTMNDWLSRNYALQNRTDKFYNDSEAKKLALAKSQYGDAVNLQNEMFDNANADLRGQIPILDERMGKYESGVRANMAQADTIGAEQKTAAQTYTGDAQRTAMQNKRQTDSQREKQYAALGTIDSYGTGSFTQGNANADSEFNRDTQQRYDTLAQNLTDIDRTVANYKTEALALIDTEKAKYEDTVRQINTQLRDNEVARRGAIKQAYYATQEAINKISDEYEGLRISAEQNKLTFEQEMEKLIAENTMPTVSDWFKQTGQPQTQDDFNFIIKNPTGATALQKMIAGQSGGKKTEKQMAYEAAGIIAANALNKLNSGLVESGFGQGIAGSFGERFGTNSSEQQSYRSDIASMRTAIQNALLGANMSPREMEQILAAIPQYSDDPDIARTKLQGIITNMPILAGNGQIAAQPLSEDQLAEILGSL